MSAISLVGWFFIGSAVFAGFVITAVLFAKLLLRLPQRNNDFNEAVLEHYRIAEARLAESARHHDRIASALENIQKSGYGYGSGDGYGYGDGDG